MKSLINYQHAHGTRYTNGCVSSRWVRDGMGKQYPWRTYRFKQYWVMCKEAVIDEK